MTQKKLVMEKVDSSMITSYAVVKESEVSTLYVKFNSGEIYSFDSIPDSVILSFISAESKGKYFHANIRGKYQTFKETQAEDTSTNISNFC
jgi:hypothetical protein